MKRSKTACFAKVTPSNEFDSMDQYRLAVVQILQEQNLSDEQLGGKELLSIIIKKWGVPYDLQLRKADVFGEASRNIYVNVMWKYDGQKSYGKTEQEYMENLEAIGQYITKLGKVTDFKEKIAASRKRPNAYFGYAVPLSLDVDPNTADEFFKDLE